MKNVDLEEHIGYVSRERKTLRKESNCNSSDINENGQLPPSSVLALQRLPLGLASPYLSMYPIASALTLPVYPPNAHKYPPLPRWHQISF